MTFPQIYRCPVGNLFSYALTLECSPDSDNSHQIMAFRSHQVHLLIHQTAPQRGPSSDGSSPDFDLSVFSHQMVHLHQLLTVLIGETNSWCCKICTLIEALIMTKMCFPLMLCWKCWNERLKKSESWSKTSLLKSFKDSLNPIVTASPCKAGRFLLHILCFSHSFFIFWESPWGFFIHCFVVCLFPLVESLLHVVCVPGGRRVLSCFTYYLPFPFGLWVDGILRLLFPRST